MQLNGEQRIAAPRAKVWEALNDPVVLRQCIPGCQSLEKESPERFRAVVEIRIGPIGARFNATVMLTDLDPPASCTIVGEGQGGMAGSARGNARVTLVDEGRTTLLAYTVDAEVGGRLAQLGGPIIEATAKQLAAKFFTKFDAVVTGTAPAAHDTTKAPETPAVAPPRATATGPGAFPVGLVLGVIAALIAGFLLGRSMADDIWIVAVIALAVICTAAGWYAGRGGAR